MATSQRKKRASGPEHSKASMSSSEITSASLPQALFDCEVHATKGEFVAFKMTLQTDAAVGAHTASPLQQSSFELFSRQTFQQAAQLFSR